MRKYKKLQQSVDESLKHIHNEKLLEALIDENNRVNGARQKAKQKQLRLIMASSCLAVILIFVIVGCLFLFPIKDDGTKHYFQDNEKQIESTMEELNSYTINVDLNNNVDWQVKKCIDTKYNDVLYFIAIGNIQDTFESFNFTFIVNKDYKNYEENENYDKKQNIYNQNIIYKENIKSETDGLNVIKAAGKIVTVKEIIYIKYEDTRLDENSNFLSSLKQVLVFKN